MSRMNKLFRRLIPLITLLLCLTLAISCNNQDAPVETGASTTITSNDATVEPAATSDEIVTEAPETSDIKTTVGSPSESAITLTAAEPESTVGPETTATPETTAEPETTAIETLPPADALSFASLDAPGPYFFRPNQTGISLVQDETEGQVLSLATQSVLGTVGTADPYVYIKIGKLAQDINYPLTTTTHPYLVIKVKNVSLWSRSFSLFGFEVERAPAVSDTDAMTVRLADTDDWQYIAFDLTKFEKDVVMLRLDYEASAAQNGEEILISEIKLYATPEEAGITSTDNTYPLPEEADRDTLRIMSFNVQTENGTSVQANVRADMLMDLLDEYQPDSIGMQEVTTLWRTMMDNQIFNDSYTGVGEARTPGSESSCIYYRSDKYDLLDSGTIWLSATPDVVGSMIEGANYPRICTYVHLKDKVTGKEFIHMNTHLDHDGDNDAKTGRAIRLEQVSIMLRKLYSLGTDIPVVITGDFNQRGHSSSTGNAYALYKLMTGQRALTLDDGTEYTFAFADSRIDAPDNMPEGFTATMTQYHDESSSKYNPAREPIDYVFYSTNYLEALSYEIKLYDRDGIYLSDHLPVFTTFRLK